MSIKGFVSKWIAIRVRKGIKKWSDNPFHTQEKVFRYLIENGRKTKFGTDHGFDEITGYNDFKKAVPVRDYEGLKQYVELVKNGAHDILWPGRPIYFCKTSGTTSGTKYIPITKQSMPTHIDGARNALLNYVGETKNHQFVSGKMIQLQGSPLLEDLNGIPVGRLSGIVAHFIPFYLQKNRMPSFTTNCIPDWEQKVDAIVEETINENMTLVGGIPSWVQMYFEKLQERSGGKLIKDIFPNFDLFVFGGVNYEPYRKRFEQLIGREVPSIEFYPASEGFIAFQDSQRDPGLLLVLNAGIFYEFIKADDFFKKNPERIDLRGVELDVNYAIILNTDAGLWGYNIGDTVKFISKKPYRIIVTGRIKHFTSAFGEHVIAEEVESAIQEVLFKGDTQINDFTVAPMVNPGEGILPYHEWFVEFEKPPKNREDFRRKLDEAMCRKNTYYADLINGKILQPLKITSIQKGGFRGFMKKQGKLGGQNKIPKLSNDREIADQLAGYYAE
jgi:hypothetical protein